MISSALLSPIVSGAQEALAAPADGADAVDTVEVDSTRDTGLNLNQRSTAGSRLNLTPLETPAAVAIIPGDQIRDWGYGSVVEAVSHAPGITTVAFPGNGNNSLSARGFYGPSSVSELYDGAQLMQAGNTVTFPFDPWNVERIEILNGPASVLYGLGFVGGAVNVVPRAPNTEKAENHAEFSAGSFHSFHEAVDSTGPVDPLVSYRFDASNTHSDGWVDRGQSEAAALSGTLRFQMTPDFVLTVSDDYGDQFPSTYEGTPLLNGRPAPGLSEKNYNIAGGKVNFVDNITHMKEEWHLSDSIVIHNDSYYMVHDRRYFEAYAFLYQPTTNTVKVTTNRDIYGYERQYGDHGDVSLSTRLWGLSNQSIVGFDVNSTLYKRSDNQTATPGAANSGFVVNALSFTPQPFMALKPWGTRPQYQTSLDQYGLFAEDRLALTDQVSLVTGLRSDHYFVTRDDLYLLKETASGYDTIGWHAGVVYSPIRDLSLYAQYAVAADPANALPSISASQQIYKLSTGRQEEIGIKQSLWNHRAEWTLAAYHIVKTNLLTTNLVNPSQTDQVGRQSSRGLEASFALSPFNHWRVEANGTILKARFDDYTTAIGKTTVSLDGYRPYMVPEQAANLWVTWDVAPEWQLRSGVQYVGKRFADNTNNYSLPGYAVAGMGVRWAPSRSLNLDLRVDNLLNTVYAAATYPNATSPCTQWILGEPRSITGTVNVSF